MISALFVARPGVYIDRPGVDPWTEDRDARRYHGPWPVVAHPPCATWGKLRTLAKAGPGQDDGCFISALVSARTWGGVIEHPAGSLAWETFDLPPPTRGIWYQRPEDGTWVTEVDQGSYGHRAVKRTWLAAWHIVPLSANWEKAETAPALRKRPGRKKSGVELMSHRERAATPPAFADYLLALARTV